jgi:diguanylate cyclase (GGDEF)-like protein
VPASLLSRITGGLWSPRANGLEDGIVLGGRLSDRSAFEEAGAFADESTRLVALLVSRDRSAQKWGARWLERVGFDVDVLSDGGQALQRCREGSPAVVVIDAQLKGCGGRVYESLLEVCENCGIPLIVLCGNGREVQKALGTPVADIVTRPFDWRVVARRAATLVDSFRTVDQLGRTLGKLREVEEAARTARDRLERVARFDRLTGLPRRPTYERLTENAIIAPSRAHRHVAILHVDFDRFKMVNEAHGREGGDEVLRQVGRRLHDCLQSPRFAGWQRPGPNAAVIGRLAGAEFALTVSGVEDLNEVTGFADAILEALSLPFRIDEVDIYVSASIGIAVAPDDAGDAERLLQHAERATLEAKRRGGGLVRFYNPALNRSSERSLEIERELRGALDGEQLAIHYQPLVDFRSGRIVAAEALLRWQHPDLGMVAPSEFIPIAEESGLMIPIGTWVLRTACGQLASWMAEGVRPIRMTANVSLCQLQRGDFDSVVRSVIEETQLPPSLLELELSERGVLRAESDIIQQLNAIKAMGVRLSVDDFGTGHAAIAYLRKFDLDVLKIDRSYVKNLETDDDDVAIASAIVAMAHRLRLAVIAEGVESEAQSRALQTWGCDEFQGFLFSPALPAPEFRRLLVDNDSDVVPIGRRRAPDAGISNDEE